MLEASDCLEKDSCKESMVCPLFQHHLALAQLDVAHLQSAVILCQRMLGLLNECRQWCQERREMRDREEKRATHTHTHTERGCVCVSERELNVGPPGDNSRLANRDMQREEKGASDSSQQLPGLQRIASPLDAALKANNLPPDNIGR